MFLQQYFLQYFNIFSNMSYYVSDRNLDLCPFTNVETSRAYNYHAHTHVYNGPACTLSSQTLPSTCKNARLPPVWTVPLMTATHHNSHFKTLS